MGANFAFGGTERYHALPMSDTACAFEDVSHCYGRDSALSKLSLSLGEGDIYGFLGANGAGKTTAVRLILGLLRLQSGDVRLWGKSVRSGRPEIRSRVGVLFENFSAPPYLAGGEYLEMRARTLGAGAALARREAAAWIERVGLGAKAHEPIRRYSLGMVRRLGIAAAFLLSPRLIILDEPTNGLDPLAVSELRALVREVNRRDGVTFLLSSHVLAEVEALCGRVGILHEGRLRAEAKIEDLTGAGGRKRLRLRRAEVASRVLAECGIEVLSRGETRDDDPRPRAPDSPAGEPIEEWILRLGDAGVPQILQRLCAAGVEVFEASDSALSLETVFRRIASGDAPGGEAPVGRTSS
jgi:ABC-type multidrug transport system ATPase subunit